MTYVRGLIRRWTLKKQKALGKLWELTLTEAKKNSKWVAGCRVGINGPKGVFFITTEDDVWDLYTLQEGPGETFTVMPNESNSQELGIGVGKMGEIIAAVTVAA